MKLTNPIHTPQNIHTFIHSPSFPSNIMGTHSKSEDTEQRFIINNYPINMKN